MTILVQEPGEELRIFKVMADAKPWSKDALVCVYGHMPTFNPGKLEWIQK